MQVGSNVEVLIEHLGQNVKNKSVRLNTKNLGHVIQPIAETGALQIIYDMDEIQPGYHCSTATTYSYLNILVPEIVEIGEEDDMEHAPPAQVLYAITLNAQKLKTFISLLAKIKVSDVFFVEIKIAGARVFLTIGASSQTSITGELTFFGTQAQSQSQSQNQIEDQSTAESQSQSQDESQHQTQDASSSTNSVTPSQVAASSMLRSTHMLKLDESRLEHTVEVDSTTNKPDEEIQDAMAALSECDDVTCYRYEYMTMFLSCFLKELERN